MSNPNFVSDLVAMAKAFEELPKVQAELEAKTHDHSVAQQMIQRLELRLIDLKNELTAAHAEIKKVEVERDHAERMFLETDDRLNAFRRLLGSFQTEAGALIAAAEPEPTNPETVIPNEHLREQGQGESPLPVTSEGSQPTAHSTSEDVAATTTSPEPGPAVGDAFTLGQGERAVDPIAATDTIDSVAAVSEQPAPSTTVASSPEAVSVQPDPTPTTPDVQSHEASSSASAGETSASTPGTAGSMQHSEVAVPLDPTASSTAGDGHSSESATTQSETLTSVVSGADASTPEPMQTSPVDDVGYHNEPKVGVGDHAWDEWDVWCKRMNNRHGTTWPARTLVQAAH